MTEKLIDIRKTDYCMTAVNSVRQKNRSDCVKNTQSHSLNLNLQCLRSFTQSLELIWQKMNIKSRIGRFWMRSPGIRQAGQP